MIFKISSDSTCDLSKEHIEKNQIHILPLTINLGDKMYKDNVDITINEVLEYVDNGGDLPKTSAISVDEYVEFFTKLTEDGSELIHFNISSKSSACYEHAVLAAQKVKGVYVVNSLQLSSGQGLLIMKACDLRAEGLSAKEVYEKIEQIKLKAKTSFVVDRLDYLHKGGRCSLLALLGAKMLKLHPHISMKDGALYVKKKYMGSLERSVMLYVQDLASEYGSYDKTRCFITHCNADQKIVDIVKKQVEELFNFDLIEETHAGTTVGSHCGKNTIGVLFIEE